MNDNLQISASGIALIENEEGCKLEAYQDAAGVWTIGYGHTSAAGAPAVHAGLQITQAEAQTILVGDLQKFEAAVRKRVTVALSQHQFDALVSFVFNVGEGAFAGSTLLRDVNARDFANAKLQFARWTMAGGRRLPGLVTRRAKEAALFAAPDALPATQPAGGASPAAGAIHPATPAPDPTKEPAMNPNILTSLAAMFSLVEAFGPLVPEVVHAVPDIAAKAGKLASDVKKMDVSSSIADVEALVADAAVPFHAIETTIHASKTMTLPGTAA